MILKRTTPGPRPTSTQTALSWTWDRGRGRNINDMGRVSCVRVFGQKFCKAYRNVMWILWFAAEQARKLEVFTQKSLAMNDKLRDPKDSLNLTVKYTLNIDSHNIIPSLSFREIIVRGAPGDTRIIHKDVKVWLALFEFGNERITPCFVLLGCHQLWGLEMIRHVERMTRTPRFAIIYSTLAPLLVSSVVVCSVCN